MTPSTLLHGHPRDLGGGFIVQRLLPSAARQAVGPFIFFDHFGPMGVAPGDSHDVRPHPHIGLATVTYLFEGAMLHRDNIGSVQRIEPGALNWMTAGAGIVHSERTPPDLAATPHRMHGLQLWAALPRAHEEDAASFSHTPASAIPVATLDGAVVKVLIGSAFGHTSPVPAFGQTLYLDIELQAGRELLLSGLPAEAAVYPVDGELEIDGTVLAPHTLAVLGGAPLLRARTAARFVVLGGAALDGPRYLFWNFVSSSKARIERAAQDWSEQRYPRIAGETEWIPLPDMPRWR